MNELENENWTASDPLLRCIRARHLDFILRVLLALGLALLYWHEINALAASVASLYLFFFLPKLTCQDLTLKSGRTVTQVTPKFTRYLHGKNSGKKVLDVCYTCGSNDIGSSELQREFEEVCLAVFSSCDHRRITAAEITAELPRKPSFFSLNFLATVARSAEFEKDGQTWKEVETL